MGEGSGQALVGGLYAGVLGCHLFGSFFESRADGFEQFYFGDGFTEVVICAEVHAFAHIGGFSAGGHEDEWDLGGFLAGTEGFQDRVAVDIGQHDIAEDEVGEVFCCHFDSALSVWCVDDVVAFEFETLFEGNSQIILILDEQEFSHLEWGVMLVVGVIRR